MISEERCRELPFHCSSGPSSLDPNFAMAYARLGTSYSNLGQTARAAENTRKAYELRERVSEREKLYIVSHYENFVTGNLEAARKTYELWAQTYPRDDVPLSNLGVIYRNLGDYDKALAAALETMKADPGSGLSYANLVSSYVQRQPSGRSQSDGTGGASPQSG